MQIVGLFLLVGVVTGFIVAMGMIFSGLIQMTDESAERRSNPRWVWWSILDHLITSGLVRFTISITRNWKQRDYARRLMIRGMCIGVLMLIVAWIWFRLFTTDS